MSVLSNRYFKAGSAGPTPTPWVRPSDWLPMPTVTSSDQTFVGLHAVIENSDNFVAFIFETDGADYEVDWGDGTISAYTTNTIAQHQYDFSTYDPGNTTLTSRGYKQAMITVTPTSGDLLTANFQVRYVSTPIQTTPYSTGFLDCILSMPNASSGQSIVFGTVPLANPLVQHLNIERFDIKTIGGCTLLVSLFSGCFFLQSVSLFDASSVTDMNLMFSFCYSLQTISLLDTSSVTNMNQMFRSCSSLQTIPLLDTSSVTNMTNMFASCSSLQTIPLLDTSSVTNMTNMFTSCSGLQTIPLLDTSSVTNMDQMFIDCRSLQIVPLFDTSSVTNMSNMFRSCFSLQTIPLLDTSSVTNMNSTFANCYSLQTIPLLDTSSVTNMANMFIDCRSLQSVPLFDTSSVTFWDRMFQNCFNLTTIPALSTAATTTASGTFVDFAFGNFSLNRCEMIFKRLGNFNGAGNINNCQLSAAAIIEIFNNLVDRSSTTPGYINITGNWGATALTPGDRAIATGKNWTITG
jgi:surface protein